MRRPARGAIPLLVALAVAVSAAPTVAQPNWVQRFPAVSPSARLHASMAYDVVRQRVVLFGGYHGSSIFNETWEWDGITWTQRAPKQSPPARSGHAMAYDASRGRIVLFGGMDATMVFNDTWEWDGTTWRQRTPATGPSARTGHALAFDAARGRTVLFGGGFNDTWEWDGTTWRQRTPSVSPPARSGNALAYDATRRRVLLFGGSAGGPVQARYNDTWEWDGTTWTQRNPAERPPNTLPSYIMAYDTARNRCVLYPAGAMNNTWEWDGATWTERLTRTTPRYRNGHALAHDDSRLMTVMYGGLVTGVGYVDETWTYGFAATLSTSGAPRLGGTVTLHLSAPGEAGRVYQFGSSLGTGPIPIGGRRLDLSPDPLLGLSVTGAWPGIFQRYRGRVDAKGAATAAIQIPSHGALVGVTIYSAFVTLNPSVPQGIQSVSNTVSTRIS